MKIVFSAIIILLLFIGCKKSSDDSDFYTITGIVVDIDSNTPVENAKVYCGFLPIVYSLQLDSAFSDINGKVSFTYRKDHIPKGTVAQKSGYMAAIFDNYYTISTVDVDRTDSLFLAKPSIVNITLHKSNVYQPSDSIVLKVKGYIEFVYPNLFQTIYQTNANNPDTSIHLNTQYKTSYSKIYLQWDIKRNGSILSTQTDSIDLIQYGTKNYNLNY